MKRQGKGVGYNIYSDEDIVMIETAAIFVAPRIALYTIFVAFAPL